MEKKLRKSPVVITLYVFAALALVYTVYMIGSTLAYVISYYSSYSMAPAIGETVTYVMQAAFQPLVSSALLFAAAKVLNEVRALNPGYYATDEEIKAAKEAKKAAKKSNNKDVEVEVEAAEAEVEVAAEAEVEVAAEAEEVVPNASMKKAELLAIAEEKGIKVSSKATKADILEALNK